MKLKLYNTEEHALFYNVCYCKYKLKTLLLVLTCDRNGKTTLTTTYIFCWQMPTTILSNIYNMLFVTACIMPNPMILLKYSRMILMNNKTVVVPQQDFPISASKIFGEHIFFGGTYRIAIFYMLSPYILSYYKSPIYDL